MTDILLCTLNSSFIHTAFGLRYLLANMGELQASTQIREFTILQDPRTIAEKILKDSPRIVGFGVYIWNVEQTQKVISHLKRIQPNLQIILGGPEVSYETEEQKIVHLADHVICGEADFLFPELCAQIIKGDIPPKIIRGPLPDISKIQLPYCYFTAEDIQNRVLYVEASRGCPYKCEYCLSSLDVSVRNFPLEPFLTELNTLLERGARTFKFVDRTFNLSPSISEKILQFFLAKIELGLFLHFEMVPDRLPQELRSLIAKFPPGSLQFEIGIQTWNPEVAKLVSRRQDYTKIAENLQFLKEHTNVHTHVDLIAGLPGETVDSFARGFDAVAALHGDEIQVGILKRLRGTPILRHNQEWQMIYAEDPPYAVLSTTRMSFGEIQEMNRFSRYWDMVANSGKFIHCTNFLKTWSQTHHASFFSSFQKLSTYFYEKMGETHGISQNRLFALLHGYFLDELGLDRAIADDVVDKDFSRLNPKGNPKISDKFEKQFHVVEKKAIPSRQQKHLHQS